MFCSCSLNYFICIIPIAIVFGIAHAQPLLTRCFPAVSDVIFNFELYELYNSLLRLLANTATSLELARRLQALQNMSVSCFRLLSVHQKKSVCSRVLVSTPCICHMRHLVALQTLMNIVKQKILQQFVTTNFPIWRDVQQSYVVL